jgi:hypothetical protein
VTTYKFTSTDDSLQAQLLAAQGRLVELQVQLVEAEVRLAVQELSAVAFVSRDLVSRAFEVLAEERRGAAGRARVLLAEALGLAR